MDRGDNTWTVTHTQDGEHTATTRVTAEHWQVGPNGDLVFGNGLTGHNPYYTRAFAAGTWLEVSLYA